MRDRDVRIDMPSFWEIFKTCKAMIIYCFFALETTTRESSALESTVKDEYHAASRRVTRGVFLKIPRGTLDNFETFAITRFLFITGVRRAP